MDREGEVLKQEKIKLYQGWKDINDARAAQAAATTAKPTKSRKASGDELADSVVSLSVDEAQAGSPTAANEQLANFLPRKERKPSGDATKRALTTDDFVGFGNESLKSQEAHATTLATDKASSRPSAKLTAKPPAMLPAKPSAKLPAEPLTKAVEGAKSTEQSSSSGKAAKATLRKSPENPVPPTNRSFGMQAPSTTSMKRSATGERPMTFASLPKMQKRTSVASPKSPDRTEDESEAAHVTINQRPPTWYTNLKVVNKRRAEESDASLLLLRLKDAIQTRNEALVREMLHKLPFKQVNGQLLKRNRTLHNDSGLPQLFDSTYSSRGTWPFDIKSDAEELYVKWCRGIFEIHLLRGIIAGKASKKDDGDKSSSVIDPNYTGKVNFREFGNNDLQNGQWFPTQLCTVRDGCHGTAMGGVSGKKGMGAYCCIMTGQGQYPNEDRGNEVLYCGTDSDDGTVTAATQLLLDSKTNDLPIRFIRGSALGTTSLYTPEMGFRYDGLYKVKSVEKLGEPKLARHRFHLVRCPGQAPIRGGDSIERRPTQEEVDAWKAHKGNVKA